MNKKNSPLVIIHGWSDESKSFLNLAEELKRPATLINLADYLSLDDAVTYDDLISAMQKAWLKHKLPQTPYSVDAIVHSTGGLIIRNWLTHFYQPKTAPIKHLVMLAPANFGSPLAHKGRAFYGRILKGLKGKHLFNVGSDLLKGLELASPYTWKLAMADRFGKTDFYGPGKILTTVLIGNAGYSGMAAIANEEGSDGTVRVACANLNCDYLGLNFSEDPLKSAYQLRSSKGKLAFAIMAGENHSTIAAKDNGPKNKQTLPLIQAALDVTDNGFLNWCKQLSAENKTEKNSTGLQNIVVRLRDEFGNEIPDYFLEFYADDDLGKGSEKTAETIHTKLIKKIHTYQANKAYRSIYLDVDALNALIETPQRLIINVTAYPEIKQNGDVGFQTVNKEKFWGLKLKHAELMKIFKADTTLLLDITLKRYQAAKVFQINSLQFMEE